MLELTDEQKEDCQKVINRIIERWWLSLKIKIYKGASFEAALEEVKKEILSEQS